MTRKVQDMRSQIDAALRESRTQNLEKVLADPAHGWAWVVKVLDVHPCLGKVAGRRALREAGIDERMRLSSLSQSQRQQLSRVCRCGNV